MKTFQNFYTKIYIITICTFFIHQLTLASEHNDEQQKILFQDSFQNEINPSWQWIRENPEAHRVSKEGLQIKIEPGGLMGEAKNAKNILVRPIPEGAELFSVVVETHHQSQYEQAGLILYTSDNDYIKLVHEHVNGKTGVVLVVETDAQARVINNVPSPSETTRLILESTGENQFTAYAANAEPNSKKILVGSVQFPQSNQTRIGVFTQSGEAGADRWATFTQFQIAKKE